MMLHKQQLIECLLLMQLPQLMMVMMHVMHDISIIDRWVLVGVGVGPLVGLVMSRCWISEMMDGDMVRHTVRNIEMRLKPTSLIQMSALYD